MNVKQLERIRMMIESIRAEIRTDNSGSSIVSEAVGELWEAVTEELKHSVWTRYLQSSEQKKEAEG